MSDTVIRVENLSKHYRLGAIGSNTLRDDVNRLVARLRGQPDPTLKIGQTAQSPVPNPQSPDTIWALKDVSFEVKQGEVVGIIGRNGAGKSTLLKILSRITAPTSGQVQVKGRIASLLEVGTGFHPELTGRENIYLNGAILGMKRAEIARKFDEIVDFSGVEQFIDTPVKRYSSGMYVRLAFAVAAHLEPEILLVDEVLAVGDAEFQKKCLGKMGAVAQEGRTVLFVSHNMASVESLCPRIIWMNDGTIMKSGPNVEVIRSYMGYIHSQEDLDIVKLRDFHRSKGMASVIVDGYINNKNLGQHHIVEPLTDLTIRLLVELQQRYTGCTFGIHWESELGTHIFATNTRWTLDLFELDAGIHNIECQVRRIPLVPGTYYLNIGFSSWRHQIDWLERVASIEIISRDVYGTGQLPWSTSQGFFLSDADWFIY